MSEAPSEAEPGVGAVPSDGPGAGGVDVDRPIFIVGAGRSGTTLLRSLFSAHRDIAVTPETHFVKRIDREGLLDAGLINDFEGFWTRYTAAWTFTDLGVEAERVRSLIEAQGEPTPRSVFRAVLRAYAEAQGKRRIGEKTPGHHGYLPTLFDWFPGARVIAIERDPRAVVASKLKNPWARRRIEEGSGRASVVRRRRRYRIAAHAQEWRDAYEKNLPPWRDDERVRFVRYEDLAREPEATLRGLCEFVGEAFDDAMLLGAGGAAPAPAGEVGDATLDQWRSEHHAKAVEPVNAASLEKWKDQLSGGEVALIEGCCKAGMERAGYAPTASLVGQVAGRATAATLFAAGSAESGLAAAADRARRSGAWHLKQAVTGAAHRLPAGWWGYRTVENVAVDRLIAEARAGFVWKQSLDPASTARNPLPVNVDSRRDLPDDAGWWGYSMHDVPERPSGETFLLTLRDAAVISYRDPAKADDFYPALLTADGRSPDLPQLRWRPPHAAAMRDAGGATRLGRGVWFLERVYHNHSHWLTAHLPKLLRLRELGRLGEVILPAERTDAIDRSLAVLGIDPAKHPQYRTGERLEVGELTVIVTDRFRGDLLRRVPEAFGVGASPAPTRRVYISRERATRRRLLDEAAVWERLAAAGFEKVFMEDLSFDDQVALMKETAVLVGPHGAGLTNMLFMPGGGGVVEVADLGFPNPNFYATAAACGHRYFLLDAEPVGEGPPLERDLAFDVAKLDAALPAVLEGGGG